MFHSINSESDRMGTPASRGGVAVVSGVGPGAGGRVGRVPGCGGIRCCDPLAPGWYCSFRDAGGWWWCGVCGLGRHGAISTGGFLLSLWGDALLNDATAVCRYAGLVWSLYGFSSRMPQLAGRAVCLFFNFFFWACVCPWFSEAGSRYPSSDWPHDAAAGFVAGGMRGLAWPGLPGLCRPVRGVGID